MEVDMMELEAGKYSIKSFTIVKKATYIFENKLDDSRWESNLIFESFRREQNQTACF